MANPKYTGSLYQLSSRFQLHVGAYVAVNGPYDTYGVVQKSEKQPDDKFLNLIRGVPARLGVKPVAQF
ncbi:MULTISPECIES: hypothetical protein [unclassified Variovorax]|uniref:hypothetical protein n=1 Tax=unclassified Variovorax TaxID=663243 RepID=UPI00076CEAD3|nr:MULTISPECIES: hypothetical protein [unclassified Variovorax]KWT98228.1 hypothetical protein APY03_0899 [Variovorax sp. WDL1]PNG50273.1 hypothetical protein CHC06_05896 [Variovorax sp. B2]PNG51146.1 hypothetical protein CHC07_05802 [Variovorax sp. B4]VTU42600.1 hypothetical protein SRS16P1_00310 [Variovorax sp. SRS16]VTU42625.1 hypothetical protein E5P1_00308 [Variovorax sp. PBL-E5]